MNTISKSQFKAKALEIMRDVEKTNTSVIITDHGKPTLELKTYTPIEADPLARLKGSVIRYDDPTEPIEDDWENA